MYSKFVVVVILCVASTTAQAGPVPTDKEIFDDLDFKPFCSPPTHVYGYLLSLVLNLREHTLMMKLGTLITQALLTGSDEALRLIPTIVSKYPNYTATYPFYLTRYKSSMHWSDILSLLNAITCSSPSEDENVNAEEFMITYRKIMHVCIPPSTLKEDIGCILEYDTNVKNAAKFEETSPKTIDSGRNR